MKRLIILLLVCLLYINSFSQPEPLAWSIAPNNTKNAAGRLLINFPPNTIWTLYVYKMTDKAHIGSYSSTGSKGGSITMAPGEYSITLNNAIVDNVLIKKGHDTWIRAGIVDVTYEDVWYLYDGSGKNYYTSGNKPAKLVMPVGNYTFEKESTKEIITVKELPGKETKPVETDQWIMTYIDDHESIKDPQQKKGLLDLNLPLSEQNSEPGFYLYRQLGTDTNFISYCTKNTCPNPYPVVVATYTVNLNNRHWQGGVWGKNIPVKENYKTRIKTGFITVDLFSDWSLYDSLKQRKYISGDKPRTFFLLAGATYHVFYKDKFYRVKVGDNDTAIVDALHFDNTALTEPGWVMTPVKAMKMNDGVLNTSFPDDPSRSISIENVTLSIPTNSYNLQPGNYLVKLNKVPVANVPVKKANETRLKAGYMMLENEYEWRLYDITGTVWYTGGTAGTGSNSLGAFKKAIPQGVYQLLIMKEANGVKVGMHRIVIKDGELFKLE